MRNGLVMVALVAVAAVSAASQASAQTSGDGWEFAVAPYLWAAGMDGTLSIGDLEQDVDVPFSDVLSDLHFALMGHFDMRNERWAVESDLVFVDLEDRQSTDLATVTAGVDLTLLEVTGGYRVSRPVTVFVGGRYVDMGASLRYQGTVVDDGASAGESWVDPLVGVHAFLPLSDKWWLGLRGDVGGFGVGSELTWQASGNVGLRVSRLVSIVLGYHAIDMDYEGDDRRQPAKLDLLIAGPQLGVVFFF